MTQREFLYSLVFPMSVSTCRINPTGSYYVYADHAQYTIKTYAKMALFPLILTGPLSVERRTAVARKEARATGKATHAAIYSYSRNALPVLVCHGSSVQNSEIDGKNLRRRAHTPQRSYYYSPGDALNAILNYWVEELRMNYVALAIALG